MNVSVGDVLDNVTIKSRFPDTITYMFSNFSGYDSGGAIILSIGNINIKVETSISGTTQTDEIYLYNTSSQEKTSLFKREHNTNTWEDVFTNDLQTFTLNGTVTSVIEHADYILDYFYGYDSANKIYYKDGNGNLIKLSDFRDSNKYISSFKTDRIRTGFNIWNKTDFDEVMSTLYNVVYPTTLEINLMDDVDFENGYISIFTDDFPYILNGNGHKIKNGKILGNWDSTTQTGSFGMFKNNTGTIKNLILSNISYTASQSESEETSAIYNIGFICSVNNGRVENCYLDGCEYDIRSNKIINAGGICGINNKIITGCCVKSNCTFNVDRPSYSSSYYTRGNMGGICGKSTNSSCDIYCCINYGLIKGSYCGGIIGHLNSGTVSSCINYGTVSPNFSSGGTSNAAAIVGGICGYVETYASIFYSISNFNPATITTAVAFKGAIIGYDSGATGGRNFCFYNNATGGMTASTDYVRSIKLDNISSLCNDLALHSWINENFSFINHIENNKPILNWVEKFNYINNYNYGWDDSLWINCSTLTNNSDYDKMIIFNCYSTTLGKPERLKIKITKVNPHSGSNIVICEQTIKNPKSIEKVNIEMAIKTYNSTLVFLPNSFETYNVEAEWIFNSNTPSTIRKTQSFNLSNCYFGDAVNQPLSTPYTGELMTNENTYSEKYIEWLNNQEDTSIKVANSFTDLIWTDCVGNLLPQIVTTEADAKKGIIEYMKRIESVDIGDMNVVNMTVVNSGTLSNSLRNYWSISDGYYSTYLILSDGTIAPHWVYGTFGNGCLKEDTLVWTSDGNKQICKLKKDDLVYSKDENGNIEKKKIIKISEENTNAIYKIVLNSGENIYATWSHKFCVKDKGLVAVRDIKINDILINNIGQEFIIKKRFLVSNDKKVYSIEVEDNNNYFVGEGKFLVSGENAEPIVMEDLKTKDEKNVNEE